eukprot:TRINITY_DN110948_c0_g1_i1.p2 TRINITY_DN110948_c0_g1~~TRINITY_DN110948_c0_g1_i1.p2  ORF type:complete len:291 (+),score=148.64 TRINITY_DN110948_c0_g1_i1:97-969(+)
MFGCQACCNADESKEVVVDVQPTAVPGVKVAPPEESAKANAEKEAAEAAEKAAKEKAQKEKEAAEANAAAEKKAAEEKAKAEAEAKAAAEKAAAEKAAAEKKAQEEAALKEAQKPRKVEFDITVNKVQGEQLGLDVDYQDNKKLQVTKVKPGLVQQWNDANPSKEVKAKDWIVAVNGAVGSTQKMITEVKDAQKLAMTIRRETEISLAMTKSSPDAPIGLDIDSTTLTIIKVKPGAVEDYNKSLEAGLSDFEMKAGDKIVAVNNATDIPGMVEQLKTQKGLKVVVSRGSS